jgi:hypothetical protein
MLFAETAERKAIQNQNCYIRNSVEIENVGKKFTTTPTTKIVK